MLLQSGLSKLERKIVLIRFAQEAGWDQERPIIRSFAECVLVFEKSFVEIQREQPSNKLGNVPGFLNSLRTL
jgi:hypothetical protein